MESKTSHEALQEVLRSIHGEPLVILISGHPDPDAIGSAMAHQRICEALGVPATIAHVLPLSHRENRALVKLLHVEMLQVSSRDDLSRFKYLSLVDTHTHEPTVELPADLRLLSIVDHHRSPRPVTAPFVEMRPDLGATCTLYTSYLQHGIAPLSSERREDSRIATALVFGIQTDTDDFSLATPTDFQAAAYAKAFCDVDLLARVGRRTIAAGAMEILGQALSNLTVIRDFAIGAVGFVPTTDRDSIATTADFLLRREDIDTVIVYGIVEDRIDGSLRTRSAAVDPAAFLQTAFGKDHTGRPYGGGRADKGGFQIPLGMLAQCEDTAALWRIAQQVIRSSLARVMPDLAKALSPEMSKAARG